MMIERALRKMSAASSTLPSLADEIGVAPVAGALAPAAGAAPTAPNKTLANERFIALDIIMPRMNPEPPSSAPQMMSTLLPSANPVAAAANPAYELRRQMTTGMSAPPMGSTNVTPRSRPNP